MLTAKEFSLLTLLLRRQGAVLSRTVIADHEWCGTSERARWCIYVQHEAVLNTADRSADPNLCALLRRRDIRAVPWGIPRFMWYRCREAQCADGRRGEGDAEELANAR